MSNLEQTFSSSELATLATNKLLKNTYILLSMTLLFSTVTAGGAMLLNIGSGTALILSLLSFGLLFWVHKVADSAQGLIAVFAFTGCLGAALGPMLNRYLALENGSLLVMQALGGTASIFLALSAYALTTRKNFSYMGGFLFTGLVLALVAGLANLFLQIPLLSLGLSAVIVLVMSGFILFDTSRIIHGGETNYIRATVSLYLSIYNLFTSLLHLLGATSGDD